MKDCDNVNTKYFYVFYFLYGYILKICSATFNGFGLTSFANNAELP